MTKQQPRQSQQKQQQEQSQRKNPKFYRRPNNESLFIAAMELLEREDFTVHDIQKFCLSTTDVNDNDSNNDNDLTNDNDDTVGSMPQKQGQEQERTESISSLQQNREKCRTIYDTYMKRRIEIHELMKRYMNDQTSYIDSDFRLLPIIDDDTDNNDNNNNIDNNVNINPLPQQQQLPNNNINNNWNNNVALAMDDNGQQQRPLFTHQQQEEQAILSIVQTIQHYRNIGVNENVLQQIISSLQLVPMIDLQSPQSQQAQQQAPPLPNGNIHNNVRPSNNNNNLTLRRIWIAIGAVVTAFLCIKIQTLPLFHTILNTYDDDDDDGNAIYYHYKNEIFDKLLYKLIRVQHMTDYIKSGCPVDTLSRNVIGNNNISYEYDNNWYRRVSNLYDPEYDLYSLYLYHSMKYFFLSRLYQIKYWCYNEMDCGSGVLHIPTKNALRFESRQQLQLEQQLSGTTATTNGTVSKAFAQIVSKDGIQASWFMPCGGKNQHHRRHHEEQRTQKSNNHNKSSLVDKRSNDAGNEQEGGCSDKSMVDGTCHANESYQSDNENRSNIDSDTNNQNIHQCFRGIHDDFIVSDEIHQAIQLGSYLILYRGSDHFDIQYDTKLLYDHVPTVIRKIQSLLYETYHIPMNQVQPIAFRVHAVGPMSGKHVPLRYNYDYSNSHHLVRLLNKTNYKRWIDKSMRHNEVAQFALPWPFRFIEPKRDTCNLMHDTEVNDQFHIHTSIFLSEGTGDDYSGGVTLYVDDDFSNRPGSNTNFYQQKIQRGISIDGIPGRLIVSTGGSENLRCILPVRSGIRATLQIWWNRVENENK